MPDDLGRWRIERLKDEHDVSAFDCGDEEWEADLNEFLKEDALQEQEDGWSRTLVFYRDDRLVGFATLLAASLQVEQAPELEAEGRTVGYDEFPTILIGRWAVDRTCKREGVGQSMFEWVVGYVLESHIGAKFLTLQVDRVNRAARSFYEDMGFRLVVGPSGSSVLFMAYDLFASD